MDASQTVAADHAPEPSHSSQLTDGSHDAHELEKAFFHILLQLKSTDVISVHIDFSWREDES